SQAPTGFQDAKGLPVRGFLIGAQVDDAVGNYDVGEAVGKLHTPQAGDDELGRFRRVRLGCRLLRPLDHVRSEIHAYRLAARADLVGGKHYVDAGATVSPDRRSANPVGLPHPRERLEAVWGTSESSSWL